jgi:hypothetical protein
MQIEQEEHLKADKNQGLFDKSNFFCLKISCTNFNLFSGVFINVGVLLLTYL